jgi:hypothetical protein
MKGEIAMKLSRTLVVLLAAVAVIAPTLSSADLQLPRPSPKASLFQVVGTTDVTIAYCRPAVRNRTIWGDLVPYDKVWRTGANEATTITFSTDVMVSGTTLTAGTYGLFTIPGKDEWTVVFNKGAKQWGAYEYKAEDDVLRIKVKPQPNEFTERMTFSFPNTTTDSTEVALAWERLEIAFTVKVDVISKALADSRKAIAEAKADDWRTPLRAAAFCIDNNVNLDEASTWLDKSIAVKEGTYNLSAKARLLAAQGKKSEAIALAKRAVEIGKAATPPDDTTPTERLLAEWQGAK